MSKFMPGDIAVHRACGKCYLLMEEDWLGELIERCEEAKQPLGISVTNAELLALYELAYRAPEAEANGAK